MRYVMELFGLFAALRVALSMALLSDSVARPSLGSLLVPAAGCSLSFSRLDRPTRRTVPLASIAAPAGQALGAAPIA